uniref:TRAF-type domain-containing protein n=1 Tax=Cyanistes caeruleus TaxID=156563 RepID=A0A8C0UF46_CYACU
MQCDFCIKKDIPAVNFIIHEIHCRRNIEICPYCSDSIPKSEMKNHIESEHVQVTCKCRMKMENSLLKDHEVEEAQGGRGSLLCCPVFIQHGWLCLL